MKTGNKISTKFTMPATMIFCIVMIVIFIIDIVSDAFISSSGNSLTFLESITASNSDRYLSTKFKLITSKVVDGEIWRPFTSIFVHTGLAHLNYNIISVINLGSMIERRIGSLKYFFAIVFSGIFSAIWVMLLAHTENGFGASTSIFGLYGVSAVVFYKNKEALLEDTHVVNWVLCAIMIVTGNLNDGLVRLEHLTSLLGGLIFGLIFVPDQNTNTPQKNKLP